MAPENLPRVLRKFISSPNSNVTCIKSDIMNRLETQNKNASIIT